MTDDLRSELDRELELTAPPSALSGNAIVTAGRRSSGRRRVAGATGWTVALAGVIALSVSLVGPGAGAPTGAGDPSASSSTDGQVAYPLPELDPNADYTWSYGHAGDTDADRTRPESTRLTDALYTQLAALNRSLRVDGVKSGPIDSREDFPELWRIEQELTSIGYRTPAYTSPVGGALLSIARGPDGPSAGLGFRMMPKGSFIEKYPRSLDGATQPDYAPTPYLEPPCVDIDDPAGDRHYDFTCTEATGPNGERVVQIQAVFTNVTEFVRNEKVSVLHNTVIVYQPNGNAMIMHSEVGGIAGDDGVIQPEELAAANAIISVADLTKILLALPQVLVV